MEDFRVDLGIFLNPENLQTVQSQIDSLSSRNVTLKINTQDVLKDVNLIKQQLKSIGVNFGGATGVSTAVKKEMAEVEKTVGKTFDIISKETKTKFANLLNSKANGSQLLDFKGIEDDIQKTFGSIGTVTTEVTRDAENKIDQFTISVKSKLEGTIGEVEKLHYRWKEIIENEEKTGNFAYSFTSSRSTDNNIKLQEEATRKATQAKKEHEAQMQKSQATAIKLRASLDGLKKEYEDLNNARPIRNGDNLEDLRNTYTQISDAVTKLETVEKNEYDVAKAKVESQIKSLKLLIEAYRKAENSGTQLRTKPVEVSKIDEEFKLDAFMAKMQRAGIVAQEFWYKINGVNADGTENQNSLKSKLGAITDTDSLNAYLNLLSNVQAEGKKLIEQKRVNDQQVAQSQENINKVFQRTLELEKQIGQTRVKIAGLDPEKDGAQIAELTNRLNDLKSESQLVKGEFGSTFSTEQVLKLSSVIQETENKIAEVKAQLQDKSAWEQQKQAAKESLEVQKQEAREVAKEYNKLLALYKEISSIKERMAKANASGDINTVTALNRELSDLNGKIHEIETNYSQLFSDEQILGAIQILERYEAKLETVNATIQDNTTEKQKKQNTREVNEEYKKLLELLSKIRSLNKSLVGVDSDNSYYKETIQQMLEFKKAYDELYVAVAKKLDVTQVDELREKAEETTRQISLLGAKYEAEINKRINDKADNIKTNFSNGQYEKEVNAVKTSFDGLRNTTTELQTAMNGLDTAYANLKTAQSGSDPQKLVVAEEAYVNALKKVKNQLDINIRTEREQISAEKMAQGKQALYSQIDVWLKNNSAAAKKFGAELREIQAQLKGADAVDLKALRAQFQETTRQAKVLGVTGKSLKDQFSQTFKTLGMYFSSTALIMRGVQYIRQMYDNVLKVDTAMTGLYRVTNLTGEQYAKLYDDMTESAKKYGSTLDDIINSTASWVRLGFDSGTSEKLSEITAMYQHVADLDYNTAVKNLVTTYKGFQSELDEVNNGDTAESMTEIVDILDKLNNEMPVTAAQVGEGLTKSAAVLQQAGASLQETAGMITGGGAVTQDFDAFGTALKISTLRIRSMKGVLEELGEEVDENVTSVSKMQTQILNLTHGKVNIFEDDGKTYKNITEVYRGIANVWKELSQTDQSQLLELIAGKNRANQIMSMVEHWSDVENAINKANNAEGTAAKENEKYMNSMQGKITATKAAWQALSNSFLSSDFLKGLIDTGQTILSVTNDIVKTIGALPPILAVIAGYLSAKNIGVFTTISQDLTGAITGVSTLSNKMGILGNSFKDISMAWQAYGKAGLKNIFANTSDKLVTSMDKKMLEDFFTQIKNGVPKVEALENTMFGASKGARNLALSVDTSKEGLKNFRTTLDGVQVAEKGYTATTIGARVATVAFQAALTFGIAIAIQGLITLFQKLKESIPTVENTTKWLKESSQEVKDLQNDINSLNDKLTTTKTRIEELLKKPSLTIVEQNELNRLQRANSELEREIQLKERALKVSQGKNADNFVNTVNSKKTENGGNGWWFGYRNYGDFETSPYKDKDHPNRLEANTTGKSEEQYYMFQVRLEDYQEAEAKYQKALQDGNEQEAKQWEERKTELNTAMSGYVSDMTGYLTDLGEYDYSTLSDEAKAAVDYIYDIQNAYLMATGDSGESVFSNIYNQERFAEGKKAIDQLKESGNLTAESLENLYKSGTNASFNAMIDNFKKVGLIADTSTNSFGLLANQINDTNKVVDENGNVINNTTEKVNRFQQLMEEKGTDKNPSFVEGIEKSVEQFQKLEDALVKFESGTLTDKEKTSLFKAFPQLTAYADNLGAGIRNLLGEMRGDVVSQFTEKIEEFKKAGATEEEIAQLEAYERTILNIADSVDSVKNALDSMKSVFKDLDSVIKDYNENQYFSLESLEKLGQNGQRYLSYLSYENGQLKINEEAYKKLVLAQIDEIETKATLQATTDLQSLTDETAAKEYLAKVNIDLAQSQLTAAQAAFQYQLALKLAQGGSVAKAAQKVADNLNSLRNIFASARSQVDDYAAAMLGATSATEKKAKASEKAKSALESEQRALEHSKKALEDEKKALEDTKSEYEKAQKAIEDLIKWTQNYIKQIKEDEVKALQDKKEKFDELIEKQKESLQAEKDLHDYEKSVGEKQDTLASNALKVSATSLDDSGAGKKAYKKAQEEYKKSKTDMEDFLYDHSIETREKALDQLKEDTDKSYDEQIKTIQDYLSNEVQLYRDACSMIDNDNGTLYAKLLNYCLTYTTTGKTEFDRMWTLAQSAMEKYNVASVGTMQFMDELKGRIYDIDDAVDTLSKSIQNYEDRLTEVKNQLDDIKDAAIEAKNAIDIANSTPLTAKTDSGDTSSNSGSFAYAGRGYDASRGMYYYKVQYGDRDYFGYVGDSSDTDRVRNSAALAITKEIGKYVSGFENYGLSQIQGLLKVNAKNLGHYASGTRSAKSGIAQINENGLETLMKKTPNGDFVIMNQDDKVYTKKQTDNLYDFASDPEKFLSEKGLSPLSQEELANLGLWGDSSQLGMINSAFGVGGLSGLIEKITGGNGVTSSSATTNNIAPVVNITIQGDATQSTVNALHAEVKNIVQQARNLAHNDLIETVLKGRKWR